MGTGCSEFSRRNWPGSWRKAKKGIGAEEEPRREEFSREWEERAFLEEFPREKEGHCKEQ